MLRARAPHLQRCPTFPSDLPPSMTLGLVPFPTILHTHPLQHCTTHSTGCESSVGRAPVHKPRTVCLGSLCLAHMAHILHKAHVSHCSSCISYNSLRMSQVNICSCKVSYDVLRKKKKFLQYLLGWLERK